MSWSSAKATRAELLVGDAVSFLTWLWNIWWEDVLCPSVLGLLM